MSEEKSREIQKNDHDKISEKIKLYFVHNPGRWIYADILFTFVKSHHRSNFGDTCQWGI